MMPSNTAYFHNTKVIRINCITLRGFLHRLLVQSIGQGQGLGDHIATATTTTNNHCFRLKFCGPVLSSWWEFCLGHTLRTKRLFSMLYWYKSLCYTGILLPPCLLCLCDRVGVGGAEKIAQKPSRASSIRRALSFYRGRKRNWGANPGGKRHSWPLKVLFYFPLFSKSPKPAVQRKREAHFWCPGWTKRPTWILKYTFSGTKLVCGADSGLLLT